MSNPISLAAMTFSLQIDAHSFSNALSDLGNAMSELANKVCSFIKSIPGLFSHTLVNLPSSESNASFESSDSFLLHAPLTEEEERDEDIDGVNNYEQYENNPELDLPPITYVDIYVNIKDKESFKKSLKDPRTKIYRDRVEILRSQPIRVIYFEQK